MLALTRGRDKAGAYYRWGAAARGGTRFHYTAGDKASRNRAKGRAMAQGRIGTTGGRTTGGRTTGGRTPRRPRRSGVSSAGRAEKKLADMNRVGKVAAYRRTAYRPKAAKRK